MFEVTHLSARAPVPVGFDECGVKYRDLAWVYERCLHSKWRSHSAQAHHRTLAASAFPV